MIKVNCPSCGVRLTAPDELAGQPVTCQKCESKFVLSKRWMNEPLDAEAVRSLSDSVPPPGGLPATEPPKPAAPAVVTAPSAATVPASDSQPIAELSAPAVNGSGNPNAQLQAISRSQYAERLGKASLDGFVEARSFLEFFDFRLRRYLTPWILRISWLLVMIVALIWGGIVSWAYVTSLVGVEPTTPSPSAMQSVAANTPPALMKTGVYLSSIAAILLTLLWIRVLFETIMLLFSIGNTLRTTAAKESGHDGLVK